MRGTKHWNGLLPALLLALSAPASALTVGFTETFDVDASGWVNATSGPVTWVAGGGPDGSSYIESTFGSINDPGTIQFRGSETGGASGGAFFGDWVGSVSFLSADVIHDAPVPVTFFFRITTGANFPAHAGVVVVPVAPGTWTNIGVAISAANPLLVPEFGTFAQTFSDVTNVQVGVSVPLGFENVPFTYGLDNVQIVPEPGTAGLLAVGLIGLGLRRRSAAPAA